LFGKLFFRKKACQTISFHPVSGGPRTQEKAQGAATSMEDAIVILQGSIFLAHTVL
jgi:hypothetical protein